MSRFTLVDDSKLLTPCLAVSPQAIHENFKAMIAIAGSADRLRPHVKTHKCPEIVKIATKLGIHRHKCATLAEAEMLAGLTSDILIAYPLVGPNVQALARLVQRFPQVRFSTLVDCLDAADRLCEVFERSNLELDIFIDLNVGMNRTGIAPGSRALELAEKLSTSPSLKLVGLHVYDGHNHQPAAEQRMQAVNGLMSNVLGLLQELRTQAVYIDQLICGGTPTFPIFAKWYQEYLSPKSNKSLGKPDHHQLSQSNNLPPVSIQFSPGTSVLSDFNYGRDFPDISGVQPAAVLLTRIISKPAPGLVTVDLGRKAVAADQPAGKRCHFLDIPDAQELKHSEEHLVLQTSMADQLTIGQLLQVQPAHICPTVALHEQLVVIDKGQVSGFWPVMRHRLYQLESA